ncbi:MAG: hypothetical protein ACKN9V_02785 [Pseudomonadota bacterium]
MLKKLWVVCALVSGVVYARELRTYAYLAKDLPSSPGENCHFQARALAERFSNLTGLPASGTCQNIDAKGNDIVIRYQAEEPLNVVSSLPDLDFPGSGYEFSSQAECEAEIQKEQTVFQEVMGKAPLLAFCRFKENYYGLRRWALVLEGFSNSKTRLAWSSSLIPGRPSDRQIARIKSAVKEKLNRPGVNIRFVFVQEDERGHLRLTIQYYGDYHEQLKGFSLSGVDSLEACGQGLHDFNAMEKTVPQFVTVSDCFNNPYRRGADLFVVVDVLRWFKFQQSAESFASYDQCRIEKDRLVEFYKKEVAPSVLEGFCTEWGSHWKINLLSTP